MVAAGFREAWVYIVQSQFGMWESTFYFAYVSVCLDYNISPVAPFVSSRDRWTPSLRTVSTKGRGYGGGKLGF